MHSRLFLFAALLLAGCGPLGPFPGGQLSGSIEGQPISDWSFVDEHETVQLETRPDDPYSLNVWIARHDDKAYISTSLILGEEEPSERAWVQHVGEDPRVRVRIDGTLYERRAVRVLDPAEVAAALDALLTKYEVDKGERSDRAWVFRLDPR